MIKSILDTLKAEDISRSTKILTIATAIRWAGWGFAENLLPIFLFSFAGSYAEAGLLKSSYELAMIITLPLFGVLADRVRATTLILTGLGIYMLVGTSYLLAGLTGMALFIVLARVTNGIGYGIDAVGRETYFRRHNSPSKLASIFGYFDSVAFFWWIAASVVGIFLVKYVPLHWLLFMATPAIMIAFLIILRWRRKGEEVSFVKKKEKLNYKEFFQDFGTWSYQLKMMLVFNLILSASWSIILFFLPIDMYTEGASYTTIILFGIAAAIPYLFGIFFGRIFDKKGPRTFVYGLLLYSIMLIALASSSKYIVIILIAFVIGMIQEFVAVGREELVTVYSKPEHFGRVNGFMQSVANMGAMAGPLIAGIVIDTTGSDSVVFLSLAGCMLLFSGAFAAHGRLKHIHKLKTI